MVLKDIRTCEDFIRYIEQEELSTEGYDTTQARAEWFVAVENARFLSEAYDWKDIAYMLLNGCEPIKDNPQAVTFYFSELFEDTDSAREKNDSDMDAYEQEAVDYLRASIRRHWGLNEERELP